MFSCKLVPSRLALPGVLFVSLLATVAAVFLTTAMPGTAAPAIDVLAMIGVPAVVPGAPA